MATVQANSCAAVEGVPGSFPRRQFSEGLPARSTASGSRGHAVIGFDDKSSGAVLAVVSLLIPSHEGEGVEDVLGLDASEAVDVEHGGIKVSPQK